MYSRNECSKKCVRNESGELVDMITQEPLEKDYFCFKGGSDTSYCLNQKTVFKSFKEGKYFNPFTKNEITGEELEEIKKRTIKLNIKVLHDKEIESHRVEAPLKVSLGSIIIRLLKFLKLDHLLHRFTVVVDGSPIGVQTLVDRVQKSGINEKSVIALIFLYDSERIKQACEVWMGYAKRKENTALMTQLENECSKIE